MGYPSKSLVERGQELHDDMVEVGAVVVDFVRPVVMAALAGLSVLLKKLSRNT